MDKWCIVSVDKELWYAERIGGKEGLRFVVESPKIKESLLKGELMKNVTWTAMLIFFYYSSFSQSSNYKSQTANSIQAITISGV